MAVLWVVVVVGRTTIADVDKKKQEVYTLNPIHEVHFSFFFSHTYMKKQNIFPLDPLFRHEVYAVATAKAENGSRNQWPSQALSFIRDGRFLSTG